MQKFDGGTVSERARGRLSVVLRLVVVTAGLGALTLSIEPTPGVAPPSKLPRVVRAAPAVPLTATVLYRLGSLRLRHQGHVRRIEVSPDGKSVASLGNHQEFRLWDLATGKLRWQLPPHRVIAFAFAPDGQTVAVDVDKDTVERLAVTSGQLIQRWRSRHADACTMCFAPDGKSLAIGDYKNTIQLWDVRLGRVIARFRGHRGVVTQVVFLAGGKLVASGGGDSQVRIWDVATGRTTRVLVPAWPKGKPVLPRDREPQALTVSPDGQLLAVGYEGGWVCVWSTATWTVTCFTQLHHLRLFDLAFAPGGLLGWGADNIGVYDVRRRKTVWKVSRGADMVCFTPDGRTLVSGATDGLIRVWDARTGKERPSAPGHAGGACALAFSPHGDTLASLGADCVVRVWALGSRRQVVSWRQTSADLNEFCLGFSPLSQTIVFAASEKKLIFGNPATGAEQASLTHPGGGSLAFAVSADGRTVAVRTAARNMDSTLHLYDARSGKRLCQFHETVDDQDSLDPVRVPAPYAGGLAFSPDGRLLASSYYTHAIRLWDLRTRKRLAILRAHSGLVSGLVFSPDGRFLVSSAGGQRENGFHEPEEVSDTIRFWHVATQRQTGEISCSGWAVAVAYSPTGDVLASVSNTGLVQVWEAASGQELFRCRADYPNRAHAAQFSPDGRTVATAMSDGTVLVWGLAPPGWAPSRGRQSRQREQSWKELGGEMPRATLAGLSLAADGQAVGFLEKRLRRVEPVPPERIQQLIADLDDAAFAKRDAATKTLAKLEFQGETALRRAQASYRSLEVRTRIARLLRPLNSSFGIDSSTLREVRAITVLRRIGTPAACRLLAELAKGAPEAAQTRAARSALQAIKSAKR